MNMSRSWPLTKLPMRLWRRFNVWRARRMYARIIAMHVRSLSLKAHADWLMRENAQPPCPLFDRLKDKGE